jgi:SAM-dependent methyltransferase
MTKPHMSIVAHYEACLAQYGDTHRGVDWPKKEDAETRYKVMTEVILPGTLPASLLDFGCGASHLYEYMLQHEITQLDYSGLDISPKFIELAQKKFPNITYYCGDILDDTTTLPEFDYIVMNGVFTEKRELTYTQMWDYFSAVLSKLFPHTRIGLAFNVMSKQVDWERDDLFHVKFDDLATFLTKTLSRHFVFRHDYRLYEYTTYVYR